MSVPDGIEIQEIKTNPDYFLAYQDLKDRILKAREDKDVNYLHLITGNTPRRSSYWFYCFACDKYVSQKGEKIHEAICKQGEIMFYKTHPSSTRHLFR